MEAIGSGLPIIGFDVPYGSQTFVTEGENGYLIPPSADQVVDQIACCLCGKMINYTKDDLASMRQASYARAEDFWPAE